MCVWATTLFITNTYKHTEDLHLKLVSFMCDLYPFLPSWDSRKKPFFFLLSSECRFGQLLFHLCVSFFDCWDKPYALFIWLCGPKDSISSTSYAFPCCHWLLHLGVIIISTKAIHKATHSQGSLYILVFSLLDFNQLLSCNSSFFLYSHALFFCIFKSYSCHHVLFDEVDNYKLIYSIYTLVLMLLFFFLFQDRAVW